MLYSGRSGGALAIPKENISSDSPFDSMDPFSKAPSLRLVWKVGRFSSLGAWVIIEESRNPPQKSFCGPRFLKPFLQHSNQITRVESLSTCYLPEIQGPFQCDSSHNFKSSRIIHSKCWAYPKRPRPQLCTLLRDLTTHGSPYYDPQINKMQHFNNLMSNCDKKKTFLLPEILSNLVSFMLKNRNNVSILSVMKAEKHWVIWPNWGYIRSKIVKMWITNTF